MTGGGRSWQGHVHVCEHPAHLHSAAACTTEACAAGPQYRLSPPSVSLEEEEGEGPEDPYLVSSQRCKFLLGADLGLGKVVLAARLGECSLEERLVCRGGRDGGGEVGDPGMPRWQR